MASALLEVLLLAISLLLTVSSQADQISFQLMTEELEWPWTISVHNELGAKEEEEGGNGIARRSLYWKTMRYCISYVALSANRIPCPPRSGRSYYTHNCFKAREPAESNPYTRGCSRITRYRR